MSTVVNKIEQILTSEYSTANFVELMQEIFDSMKLIAPNNFKQEFSNFSTHIVGKAHVGNYTTPEGKKIAIFSVQLKKESYVESSRSTQRSYAKKLIEGGNCDAAIVAFYTEGEPKWRLSFVRLDYEMKIEQGKLKTTENMTPAKRYSFLVGKDEPSHTAIDRFRQFIINRNANPSLDELEEAFSVEKVTKEFFELYCEKFYQLQEYLDSNEDFVEESKRCGFTSEQFAKKLLGQIVFLYFLQKKGWLGVNVWAASITDKEYKNIYYTGGAQGRIIKEHLPKLYVEQADGTYRLNSRALDTIPDDEEEVIANHMVRRKTWGDGSKKFLRTIFEHSKTHKGHFFENYLEPLFYDTLNRNRGSMGYCPALHARVPFLSGGLFEPLDSYDWRHNSFDIPDEIFSNKKDDNDRSATGILDIFDRYNFTMSEDEPMEREVAIDPEMLGKIFENLLEVRDRKSKGAFYTPREIVHYMCQESLVNYLIRKTGLPEAALRDFILYGDFMKDEDTVKSKREGNGGMLISPDIFKIDENGDIIVNRLKDIDDALATVRVADPAVGSGAFPLGMVNEIVRARENITAYITIGMNANRKRLLYKNERSPYALKYNAIRHSIFAVDIEPSAVDITQLRLWLSLVIDDEITPDAANDLEGHKNPLPLPNLECNILCGNSLVDEFMGIKLIRESDLLQNTANNVQLEWGQEAFDTILKQLLVVQDKLFACDDPNHKTELKLQLQSLKDMIIDEQLKNCAPDIKEAYARAVKMASKPFTLWHLDFARVFRDKGGFDIVIGNPPYVQVPKGYVNKNRFPYAEGKDKGKQNLYKLFVEHAYNICAEQGNVALIVQSSLMCDLSSMYTRQLLLDKTRIKSIIEFPKKSSDAKGQVFDGVLQGTCICMFKKEMPDSNATFGISIGNNTRTIEKLVFERMEQNYVAQIYPESLYIPLIKPGEFKILEKILSKSKILLEHMQGISQGDLNLTGAKAHFSNKVTQVSLLRGRHIGRYYIHNDSDEYVEEGFLQEKVASNRTNTYIVGQEITGTVDEWRLHFALTQHDYDFLFGHTSNKILLKNQSENLFVLGVLNSKLQDWFFRKTSTNNHVMGYELKQLPIPEVTHEQLEKITGLVETIVNNMYTGNTDANTALAEEIDSVIYNFYGLTEEEVHIIETRNG